MKTINYKQIGLTLALIVTIVFAASAQYTLTDDDVVVVDGVITECGSVPQNIIIPLELDGQTVKKIGQSVFARKQITDLDLSQCTELTTIGNNAFNVNEITDLDLSQCTELTTIGNFAFDRNRITSVNLSQCTKLRTIGDNTFVRNQITSVSLNGCAELIAIGSSAFSDNQITNLDLNGCTVLTTIGNHAFAYLNRIENLDLSSCTGLMTIGLSAFDRNTGLNEFVLPRPNYDGFTEWLDHNGNSYAAGDTVTDLVTGYYADIAYTLTDDDVVVVNGTIVESVAVPHNIIIPLKLDGQTVMGIGEFAFQAKGIRKVTFPDSLKFIGWEAFAINNPISYLDLSNLKALERIEMTAFVANKIDSVNLSNCTALTYIGPGAFEANNIQSINLSNCTALTTIDNWAFSNNPISQVNLSNCIALTYIGPGVFQANSIQSINLSNCTALTTIDNWTFYNNPISQVNLNNCTALTYIGQGAFGTFMKSTSPVFLFPKSGYEGYDVWKDQYGNNYNTGDAATDLNTVYNLIIPYTLTDEDVTMTNGIIESCTYDSIYHDIVIPPTLEGRAITGINSNAFAQKNITSVDLPSSITQINDFAFYKNSMGLLDLKSCTSLTYIGECVFDENLIRKITLPIPDISGYNLEYWECSSGSTYAGGSETSDFISSYTAKLVNVTGINEPVSSLSKIYPNPVIDQLTITIEGTYSIENIKLYDIKGVSVPVNVLHNSNKTTKIDMSDLLQGIYLLNCEINKVTYSKIIIKK